MHFADDLFKHAAGLFLIATFGAGDHLAELPVGHFADDRLDLRGAEHILGLTLELWFGDTHSDDGNQTCQNIVTFDFHVGIFEIHFELTCIVFDGFANLLGQAQQIAIHMGSTARGFHHIDEAAHGGVVSVGPPHGDIDGTISRNLLRVQFTAIANGLGFLNIGVFASDTPNSGNRFAFGQVIHEILHTAGMAEFLDTGVGILRPLRLCRNIGFLDLLRSFLVPGSVMFRFIAFGNFLRFITCSICNIVDFQHFVD